MILQYRKLCSIAFKHAYYRDNTSRDFSLVPTPSSLEQMQRFGLLAKTISGKTTILQKMDDGAVETPITDPICLSFILQLNNPLLLNVTETFNTRHFYLTNLASNGSLKSLLTDQAGLTNFDALPPLSPKRFSMSFPKGEFQLLAIKKAAPPTGFEILPPLSISSEMENVEVNLRESGKYILSKEPISIDKTIYATNEITPNASFFGVLDLFLDQNIAPAMVYEVMLQPRIFKWQYFLVDVKNKESNFTVPANINLEFVRNAADSITPNGVLFTFQDEMTMSPDSFKVVKDIRDNNLNTIHNVYLFESNTDIPILESRSPIVKMNITTSPTVTPQLPVPDITNVQIRLPTPTANTANAMIFYNI